MFPFYSYFDNGVRECSSIMSAPLGGLSQNADTADALEGRGGLSQNPDKLQCPKTYTYDNRKPYFDDLNRAV